MASRRYPLCGRLRIQHTPLTTAISNGDFKSAEQIIEATTSDPALLNNRNNKNIPLRMVLTNNHCTQHCRNLRLAKLLVQKGANPNLRIPEAFPSPFEELVVYYEMLRSYVAGISDALCEELEIHLETEKSTLEFLTNTIDLNNVKCLPNLENCYSLIEQTRDLIEVFLHYGSDPSILTTFNHKSLFHWVIEHEDIILAKRFLDTCRVNLNIMDVHGNTPLMDTILRNKPENSLAMYETMCDTADSININRNNCCGETALFRAVFVGATEMVNRLCRDGAKLSTIVSLSWVPEFSCQDPSYSGSVHLDFPLSIVSPMTTPFLASLLADSPVRLRYTRVSTHKSSPEVFQPHKHLVDKIISASVSPLIDSGCFSNETVASETMRLFFYRNFCLGEVHPTDLLNLMFGQVAAGLRQLCVRTILDHCLAVSQVNDKSWLKVEPDVFCISCCEGTLTSDKIKWLMEILCLPLSFQIFFEIEAAKYQTCSLIMNHQRMNDDQVSSASDMSMSDNDD